MSLPDCVGTIYIVDLILHLALRISGAKTSCFLYTARDDIAKTGTNKITLFLGVKYYKKERVEYLWL